MDYQIQVVTVPVTDVDQAAAFYSQQAGLVLDVDYHPAGAFRVVQLTPPGSAYSVQFGVGTPRLRQLRRLHRPGRQHLGPPGDRLPRAAGSPV